MAWYWELIKIVGILADEPALELVQGAIGGNSSPGDLGTEASPLVMTLDAEIADHLEEIAINSNNEGIVEVDGVRLWTHSHVVDN